MITGCAGGENSPAGPSPSPSPSPGGGGSTNLPSGMALETLSLSAASVQSQAQPTGTVTLTQMAPASGIVVALSSSNTQVVRVPATVTVPGGANTASFTVDTSTVVTEASATITAALGNVSRAAGLTVRPQSTTPSFTVTSRSRGAEACLQSDNNSIDCVLDGSRSSGPVHRWIWTYGVVRGTPLTVTMNEPTFDPELTNECDFYRNGDSIDPGTGRYFRMEITLVVEDSVGNRSAPVRREVRLYPNFRCGYSF